MNSHFEYHDKIMTNLKEHPLGLSAPLLAKILSINLRQMQRLLAELKKRHLVISEGAGRATVYIAQQLRAVPYSFSFLKELIKTEVFSKIELENFQLIGKRSGETVELDTFNAKIYERLIVDLSWSSSFLEGNTYSLLETENLILKNEVGSGKNFVETQMILNHKEAIKFIVQNRAKISLSGYAVKSVHALLSEGLLANTKAQGVIRLIPVGIEGTRYLPLDIPQQIEAEFDKMLIALDKVKNPILKSFYLLAFLPYLQPFEDLNKRTSRICCNIPLIQAGYVPISFMNIERAEYLTALKDIYEFNNIEKLKSIYLKSYWYSVEHYRYIKQNLIAPSALQIKYRNLIKEAVFEAVTKQNALSSFSWPDVLTTELQELKSIIQYELSSLHVENLIRFGITPLQFKKWKPLKN